MFRKAWSIFTSILLIFAAVLAAAFLLPRLSGLTPYVVTSGSMEPMYPVGSLIYVQETDPEDVKEGDSITFYMDNGTTIATHQVYEIDREQEQFYTQGINNRDSEGNILHDASPVAYRSLIGRPRFMIPYLGYINRICTTIPGIYILTGAAAVILILSVILDRTAPVDDSSSAGKRRGKKKKRRKQKRKRGT